MASNLTKAKLDQFAALVAKFKRCYGDDGDSGEIDGRIDAENDICGWLLENGESLIAVARQGMALGKKSKG